MLAGLSPEEGVAVYIDDILVFSHTLEKHLEHLQAVIERLEEAQLKLKPVKCQFICKEVDYLGHVLTPEGLKVNTTPACIGSVLFPCACIILPAICPPILQDCPTTACPDL